MMKRLLVAGNWKMHGSTSMTAELLRGLEQSLYQSNVGLSDNTSVEVLVCPSAAYLSKATDLLADSQIKLGAQNVSQFEQGAYTGEISLPMLADLACDYVIIGHSERRELYGESDQMVAEKFAACIDSSLVPILCVGETLAHRQSDQTKDVIARQIDAVLSEVGIAGFERAVIAYEPVWAIGTGETASPEQAQQVHQFIRGKLAELDSGIAQRLLILYGGSVKSDNATELFSQVDINGGLIGGASLQANDFSAICLAADKIK